MASQTPGEIRNKIPVGAKPLERSVLIGMWDVTKKAVESQSARAWNERIIKTINEKIIPKRTPEELAFIAKHHMAIERAATVSGIIISSAEIYTVFLLAALGKLQIDRMRAVSRYREALQKHFAADPGFQDIKRVYDGIHSGKKTVGFFAFATAINTLLNQIESGQRQQINAMLRTPKNIQEADIVLERIYKSAFCEAKNIERRALGQPALPLDNPRLAEEANASYGEWRNIQWRGLDGVLHQMRFPRGRKRGLYQAMQGVDNHAILAQYIQSIMPLTGDEAMLGGPPIVVDESVEHDGTIVHREKKYHGPPQSPVGLREGREYQLNAKGRMKTRRNEHGQNGNVW